MKASVCIEIAFTEYPFEERFAKIKEAGYSYFEFSTWEDKDLEMIKAKAAENGLEVASFSGDKWLCAINPATIDEYVEFTKRSIDTAIYLGAKSVTCHSNALLGDTCYIGNTYPELKHEVKFANMVLAFTRIAAYAEEKGITVNIEALNTLVDHPGSFLHTTEDTANVVKLVNSPRIKVLFDAYHMHIMEGNTVETFRKYQDDIGYVHIADNPGRHEPGTGEMNYDFIMKAIADAGYEGFVGLEFFPQNDTATALAAVKKYF